MTTPPEAPQVDLFAGLRFKKKTVAPKIDLSAGLVAKVKVAPVSNDRPLGETLPQQTSSANPSVTQRKTKMRPPAVVAPPRGEPIADEQYPGAEAEPPSVPEPVAARLESIRSLSPVIPEPPSAQEAAPSVRPRITRLPGAGEAQRPAASQPYRGREPRDASQAPYLAPSTPGAPPAQSWDHIPASYSPQPAAPETDDLQASPKPEEQAFNAATRMSGLRNLIYSLGLKNAHSNKEDDEQPAPLPPAEPLLQRPAFTNSYAQVPYTPAANGAASRAATLVTAPPEILPPKPMVEQNEKHHAPVGASASRRDRRDTYDDVEILPSWRGQYKKRD